MLRPTLDQIESVLAVVAHGSTVEAARMLGRSQSQVSTHIAGFEQCLEVNLFQRRNGRLFLNDSAQQIISASKSTLMAHRTLCRLGRQADKIETFKIAAPRSLSMSILPRAMAQMSASFPKTKFVALFLSYDEIVTAVATGEAQTGIAKLPILDKRIVIHHLCDVGSVIVMKKDDPLCAKSTLGPSDLAGRSIVRLGSGMTYWEKIEMAFRVKNLIPKFDFEVGGVGPACRLVAEGVGVAIVNEFLALEYLDLLGLEARRFQPDIRHEFVRLVPELDKSFRANKAFGDTLSVLVEATLTDAQETSTG